VFTSRYYLDQHFDSRHASELSKDKDNVNETSIGTADPEQLDSLNNMYCPAVEWCQVFSDQACQDMALELEPYYDRGSDGWGSDRWTVERKFAKAAHAVPCTTVAMNEAAHQCRRAVGACFGGDDTAQGRHLEEYLCATISCHGRLHRLFAGTGALGVTQQMHMWQDEWTYFHQEHGKVGWMGLILIVGLLLWYAGKAIQQREVRPHRNTAGTRLLRKSSTGSSWSTSTSAFSRRKPNSKSL
jgi:hypothetical protein